MNAKRLVAAMGIAVQLATACGGSDDAGSNGGQDAGGGGGAASLTAANLAFEPESLTVAAGESIELTNEDGTEHNFTAEDAELDEDVDAGASITIDVGAVDPGTYDFFCKYHKDSMTGILEVTE